jgi:5-methylthioadenosine/S-adenosylhomocysteine deaminase
MPERTVLNGGIVLSLDKKVGNFSQADVLIEGSKIAAVGPNLKVENAEVIDASNMIVMPGFIDTHRHLWEGILRNIGTDIPLEGAESYLAFVLNVLAPAYRARDVYVGNKISTLGLIDAGITTILDWSHI